MRASMCILSVRAWLQQTRISQGAIAFIFCAHAREHATISSYHYTPSTKGEAHAD
jgi:hypothetical protein